MTGIAQLNALNNQDTQGEKELYSRMMEGDTAAFGILHERLKTRLLFYARKLGLEWEDAQEVVSDSFIALWHSRRQLQSDEHISKFLYVTVHNKAVNRIKERQRYQQLLRQVDINPQEEDPVFNANVIKSEMFHQLGQAMEELPGECKRVFVLTYHGRRSPGEIAKMLDMNPATVRSQKRRAIRLIRDWIEDHVPVWIAILSLLTSCVSFMV